MQLLCLNSFFSKLAHFGLATGYKVCLGQLVFKWQSKLLANKLSEFDITNMYELRVAHKGPCNFLPHAAKNDRFLLFCRLVSCKVN